MKIAIVVTSPMIINHFLYDQIEHFSKLSNVTVVTNVVGATKLKLSKETVVLKHINIIRKISLLNDVMALFKLASYFRIRKFDLVYSVTPKAGLLAMLAGYLTKTPCRIHVFTGQVWATRVGLRRFILKRIDMLLAALSTHLLADSFSQKKFLVDENVVIPNKIKVLANGSISGVDLRRFKKNSKIRNEIRDELNVRKDELVFLFLGRLIPDKGIIDLIDAFMLALEKYSSIKLVIVGPDEANMRDQILLKMGSKSRYLQILNITEYPENYMNAADILCLPSYREGFGSVVIEAAAVGMPTIGSDIYGLSDAIEDGVTGILFPAQNSKALYSAMKELIIDSEKRSRLGINARLRAERLFSQDLVTSAYVEYCMQAAEKSGHAK